MASEVWMLITTTPPRKASLNTFFAQAGVFIFALHLIDAKQLGVKRLQGCLYLLLLCRQQLRSVVNQLQTLNEQLEVHKKRRLDSEKRKHLYERNLRTVFVLCQ